MRNREEWMNKASDPLLELLDEDDMALPPKTILINFKRKLSDPPSRSTLFRAIEDLEENGYIERYPTAETHYVITDKGREYLRGN
jgi:DNA-binding PadR family transcriptional regulator